MAQLVGLPCALCDARIDSTIDGRFCEACGCAVHARCAAPRARGPDSCEACGAPAELAKGYQQASRQEEDSFRRTYLRHRLSWGILEFFGGLVCLAVGALVLLGGPIYGVLIMGCGLATTAHGIVLLWRRKPRDRKDL